MAVNLTKGDVPRASFKYNLIAIALEWDVYYRWRSVGRAEGLTKDNEIASFLLQRYQKSIDGVQVTVTCIHCHQSLKVKVQNVVQNNQSNTVCEHGQNALQLKFALPYDPQTVDSEQKERECAGNSPGGKSAEDGQLQHTATAKQLIAGSNSKKVTEVKLKPEITSSETAASGQKGRGYRCSLLFGNSAKGGQLQHRQPPIVKVQNAVQNKHSNTVCAHGKNAYEQNSALPCNSRSATGKQHIASNDSKQVTPIGSETAKQPTGFGGQKDASEVPTASESGKSETDTVSIKPDPDCMSAEQSDEFQRRGRGVYGEIEMESPAPVAHNTPDGEQKGTPSIVTSGNSEGDQLKSSQSPSPIVPGTDQMHVSNDDISQTLGCAEANQNRVLAPCLKCWKVFEQNHWPAHEKECATIKKRFVCSRCDLSFQADEELQRHMQSHTHQPYCCNACDTTFSGRRFLKDHIRSAHSHDSEFLCFECGASYPTIRKLNSHKRSDFCAYRFECHKCDYAFMTPKDLDAHLLKHKRMEIQAAKRVKHEYACSVCSKTFMHASQLISHLKTHTNDSSDHFKCQMCEKKFATVDSLKEHTLANHPDDHEKYYTCDICKASVKFLYGHMLTHTKPCVCKMCNAAFATSFQLKSHMRKHSGEKNFACDQCPKLFYTKKSLDAHLKVHAGIKSFTCEDCGKAFILKSTLRRHRRMHTGEKPFVCEFCGVSFTQKCNMDSHKLIRHRSDVSEKKAKRQRQLFTCSECGAVLYGVYNYSCHMRAHRGEQPYRCIRCGAAYSSTLELKVHIRKHQSADCSRRMCRRDSPKKKKKKNFECSLCGCFFPAHHPFYIHMRERHSGELPYQCAHCDAAYFSIQGLDYHTSKHHTEQVPEAADDQSQRESADTGAKSADGEQC